MIDKNQIIANLKNVYDPEISVNVYDLGLIYDIAIDQSKQWVEITATLTSAFCPFSDQIIAEMTTAGYVEGVAYVNVTITFDPPFTMAMVSEETKMMMGWL